MLISFTNLSLSGQLIQISVGKPRLKLGASASTFAAPKIKSKKEMNIWLKIFIMNTNLGYKCQDVKLKKRNSTNILFWCNMMIMLRIIICILIISQFWGQNAAVARPILVTDAQIQNIAENPKSWARLKKRCNKDLDQTPQPTANFAPQAHYNGSGTNLPDPTAKALATDSHIAYRTALCYLLSGDVTYARKAQSVIDAYQTTMLKISNEQGASDINFNFAQFVIAASWVENVDGWNASTFKTYLKKLIAPLSHANKPNNHGDWGVLLDASMAVFLENRPALDAVKARWIALINSQIAGDGSMPLEICRSNSADHCGGADKGINGLAYTHYALLPASIAAQVFQVAGAGDVYHSPAGTKLNQAFVKAVQWTNDPKQFPYYASNHGKLNKVDRCSYFPLLNTQFQNKESNKPKCSGDIYELQTLFP